MDESIVEKIEREAQEKEMREVTTWWLIFFIVIGVLGVLLVFASYLYDNRDVFFSPGENESLDKKPVLILGPFICHDGEAFVFGAACFVRERIGFNIFQ